MVKRTAIKLLSTLVFATLFISCDYKSSSHGNDNKKTGPATIKINEQVNSYKKRGEAIRLSHINQTYYSDIYGYISTVSYMDFSSGAGQIVARIFFHKEDKSYSFEAPYNDYVIVSTGAPKNKFLPILLGKARLGQWGPEFTIEVVESLTLGIWDLEKKQFVYDIPLTNNYCPEIKAFYEKHQDAAQKEVTTCNNNFFFPLLFSIMDASRPFVGFNNQDEVDIILPVKTAFVRYQINPVENTIKEQLIGEPSFAYVFPASYSLTKDSSSIVLNILLSGTSSHEPVTLGNQEFDVFGDQYTYSNGELILNSDGSTLATVELLEKDEEGFASRYGQQKVDLGKGRYFLTKNKKHKHDDNEVKLEFFNKDQKTATIKVRSSSFDINWATTYLDRYAILFGNHGGKHAVTNSLIEAGSVFLLVFDLNTKKLVVQSEFYTGNAHRPVTGGINGQTLWLSLNKNWGGNHDGDTVRRTTSGNIFEIELPDVILEGTQLQFDPNDSQFRPFSGKIEIN